MKDIAVRLAVWLLSQEYVMSKRSTAEDALFTANHELRNQNQAMHRELKRLRLDRVVQSFRAKA